jgi:hypothetical protein
MNILEKKEQLETPHILLNHQTGELLIEGKSFPPDVVAYYSDILQWLDDYSKQPAKKTKMILKLDYFNTASSKIIMDILYKMEELYTSGNDVIVEWYYPEDDEDMMETGQEYAELIKVPFKTIGYKFMID